MNWEQVCRDPILAELPGFKIETNRWGEVVMNPANRFHSDYQGKIIRWLNQLMTRGRALPELAIDTLDGTKAPDVVWISDERWDSLDTDSWTCSRAAEICVEVLSPDNSREQMREKSQLYFQAGAEEVWLCDRQGKMTFFDANGPLEKSRLCPEFPAQI